MMKCNMLTWVGFWNRKTVKAKEIRILLDKDNVSGVVPS